MSTWCGQLLYKFQLDATNIVGVIGLFVFFKNEASFAHMGQSGPVGTQ